MSKELHQELTAPLIGATISSYEEGVAELILKSGQRSRGYVFLKRPDGKVEFFFDESVGDLLERLYLPCTPRGNGLLVASGGNDIFILKRIASSNGTLPTDLRDKILSRQGGRIRLDNLLLGPRDKYQIAPSSDGKAYLPGVQGK